MKTSPIPSVQLSNAKSEVAILVEIACTSGPVVVLRADGTPGGVILGFDDAEDAEDWIILNNPRVKAGLEESYADKAAGRVTTLEELERTLGA